MNELIGAREREKRAAVLDVHTAILNNKANITHTNDQTEISLKVFPSLQIVE